jgi:hypothetical protein
MAFEHMHVQAGLGQESLELAVLGFELMQALGFGALHTAELDATPAERRLTESAVAVRPSNWQANHGLLEKADDLLFGEPTLLNASNSPVG